MNHISVGKEGERKAKRYLKKIGYKFITQNYTTKYGEIDLIFIDKDQLVFVEVKTRTNDSKGMPQNAINQRKIEKISRIAHHFMQKNPDLPQYARIDSIAILGGSIIHDQNISQ